MAMDIHSYEGFKAAESDAFNSCRLSVGYHTQFLYQAVMSNVMKRANYGSVLNRGANRSETR